MYFGSMNELKLWLKYNQDSFLDSGSQGECYKIGNKVFKIFLQFIDIDVDWVDSYKKEDIMQFSSIVNNTYIFPNDVIMVGDELVGYVTNYIDSKSLFRINPLCVNLDKFEQCLKKVESDVKIISDNGILSYDVMYNILYGKNGFNVIDTLDYCKKDQDSSELYKLNYERFIYEVRMFLIDGIFDRFLDNNKLLYDMCYDKEANFVDFLKEFRNKLSENEGMKVKRLIDAKKSMSISKTRNYVRELY